MNSFLEQLAGLYAPLGRRGRLMDGQFRFAPDTARRPGGRKSRTRKPVFHPSTTRTLA